MVSMSEKMAKGVDFSAFSKATDLHKRLWFTLLAIIVFRFGTYVPFPGIDPHVLNQFFTENQGGLIGMFNAFTGGALSRMSIFALNIMPYISASIIIQLAASVFPSLIALKKEGEVGFRKMQQYTRMLTIVITIFQAYFMALALERGNAVIMSNFRLFEISTIVSLLGGTMFVVWLGEQMTARGVGNGTSILIMVGIVANIPMALMRILEDSHAGALSGLTVMGIAAMIFAVIFIVVLFETAQRRIVIQYPKHQMGGRVVQGVSSHLPLKINPTGVMPPIFASALLAIPVGVAQYFSKTGESDFWNKAALLLTPGQWVYVATFAILIVFFTFFYTGVQSNPKETAENLKRQGGFVAGIRPGENTAKYLDYVITRLTVLAAVYLTFLCILPEFLIATFKVPFFLGGTTLLIVVSVILDTISQAQSHLLAYQYEGLIKKAKLRGRF